MLSGFNAGAGDWCEGRLSPLSFSSFAVSSYLNGRFPEAARHFETAMEARAEWPDQVREFHWAGDACDPYLLAMTHLRIARSDPERMDYEGIARGFYDRGERLYDPRRPPPFEFEDVLERVCGKAREVPGIR